MSLTETCWLLFSPLHGYPLGAGKGKGLSSESKISRLESATAALVTWPRLRVMPSRRCSRVSAPRALFYSEWTKIFGTVLMAYPKDLIGRLIGN
jgi:hypothetical protein